MKTRNESLIKLREKIGMKQREFASFIGVSLDLIKGVETGRNKMSDSLARRIFMATGANSGLDNPEHYTKARFEDWNSRVFPSNEGQAWKDFEEVIAPHMMLLLLATTRHTKASSLQSIMESWSVWLKEAAEHFDLVPQIKEILKMFPVKEKRSMTWGEWRAQVALEAKLLADWREKNRGKPDGFLGDFTKRWYKFKDNPKKKDFEKLSLSATSYYGFCGCGYRMKGLFKRLKSAKGKIGKQ